MTDDVVVRDSPPGLGERGRLLWETVSTTFELTVSEVELLTEAARTADDCERLVEALTDEPLVVVGSAGQPRPNPLSKELRDTRQLLGRLLAQLEIPSVQPGEGSGEWDNLSASQRARKAARARWS